MYTAYQAEIQENDLIFGVKVKKFEFIIYIRYRMRMRRECKRCEEAMSLTNRTQKLSAQNGFQLQFMMLLSSSRYHLFANKVHNSFK